MTDYWNLKIKKYKDSTGNWQTTISGGYLDIVGKVDPMIIYKESDYIKDSSGNNTTQKANGGYWKVGAELTGLINPFTNPVTNLEVKETKIEVSFEDYRGWDNMVEYKNYYQYLAMSASTKIAKRYKELFGIQIELSLTFVKGESTTPISATSSTGATSSTDTTKTITEVASVTGSSTSVVSNGASSSVIEPMIYGEFTFNVEDEFIFKGNLEFGTLEVVGKGIIKEELEDVPQEEVDSEGEYSEQIFQGPEEALAFQGGEFIVIDSDSTNDIKGYDPENPNPALSTSTDSKYPISKDTDSNIKKIIEVAKKSGITNKYSIAAMLAICKKESGFVPQSEGSYSGTSATRIKSIFSKFKKYSDDEVDRIKKNYKEFFDIIYGGEKATGKLKYGNAWNEGYKYRGRGLNQITFKGNYIKYKELSGYDIVVDPDLLNTIDVAAKCLVEYFKSNIKAAPNTMEYKYNFTDINSFKNLDDAMGAFYHANAGWGKDYSEIISDSTGGRKKAFKYVGPIYNTYLKG